MVANGEEDRSAYVDTPGELSFSEVKTRRKDSTIKTVGRISSSFDEQLDRVSFDVVYRDPAGQVAGRREGSVDFIPANGDVSFMVQSYSEKRLDIATTEVFLSDFLPPTE